MNQAIPNVELRGFPGGTVRTDGSGSYSASFPDQGWSFCVDQFHAVLTPAGYAITPATRECYDSPTDLQGQPHDYLVTSPTIEVSGTVRDQSNNPIIGVEVRAVWESGALAAADFTNTSGEYQLTLVSAPDHPWEGILRALKLGHEFHDITGLDFSQDLTVDIVSSPTPPPPPNTIRVFGSFNAGTPHPVTGISGALIEVWDRDAQGDDDLLGTTTTGTGGAFSVTVAADNDRSVGNNYNDIFVVAWLENADVVVQYYDTNQGWVRTNVVSGEFETGPGDTELNVGPLVLPIGTVNGASIYSELSSAQQILRSLTANSIAMPRLVARMGAATSGYDPDYNTLMVSSADDNWDDRIRHQFGLAVLDVLGDLGAPACAQDYPGALTSQRSARCAWEQGFAYFLTVATTPGDVLLTWTQVPVNLETGLPDLMDNTHAEALVTAGNVAMALHDLADWGPLESSSSGRDEYNGSLRQITDVLRARDVHSFVDFWNAWRSIGLGDCSVLPVLELNRFGFNTPPTWLQPPGHYVLGRCQPAQVEVQVVDAECLRHELSYEVEWIASSGGLWATEEFVEVPNPSNPSDPGIRLWLTPGQDVCGTNNGAVHGRILVSDGVAIVPSQQFTVLWTDGSGGGSKPPPEIEDPPCDDPPLNCMSARQAPEPGEGPSASADPPRTLRFEVPRGGAPVRIDVFDVRGRRVQSVLNEFRLQGSHRVQWNGLDGYGRPAESGVYFVRVAVGRSLSHRRFVIVR